MKKAIIECKNLMLDHGYLASSTPLSLSSILAFFFYISYARNTALIEQR